MSRIEVSDAESRVRVVERAVADADLPTLTTTVADWSAVQVVEVLERLDHTQRAVLYRVLPKDRALTVFESLPPTLQRDLLDGLRDDDVAALFAGLDPDDRVELLDELPAAVATALMRGLPDEERTLTSVVLGYPSGSIGRRMSPELVTTHPELTVAETLERVTRRLDDAETVYTVPVTDGERTLLGVVSLRDLLRAAPETRIADIVQPAEWVHATDTAEDAARFCAQVKHLAVPVVDAETRLVGIVTMDDALRLLEDADTEDQARIGGTEPLRQPYLTTPVRRIVRSRVVWLLVLALGATLTVQVLEIFESTLDGVVTLALFVPLLVGTGGNTGNQAATTVTRALALGEIGSRDVLKVVLRELRVGLFLGALLGGIAYVLAGAIYGYDIGLVIGLTLLAVCTMAATVGGMMPLVARAVRADPAVFSNPFITTFVDATGLILYFLIAKAVLGL
ncbi:magnesium transporter [Prescottella sp. R16]|uniref:magnesium transporter n=1 Tax=Prescottella sp. R16 TaxID=3064529 RepID=UPI00272E9933|nr:magnesium transporter [Prescottella sp. R16]